MNIRLILPDDAEAVAALSAQLGYSISAEQTRHQILAMLENKDYCIYGAFNGESMVGWIQGAYTLRLESEPFVEIGGLVVASEWRSRGVGKMLVQSITEWAIFKQCGKIRVRTNAVRKEAPAFYQHLGFEERKLQKVFDRHV